MSDNVALCVDLDGTLIHSDLLLESFLLLIKENPLYLLLVPFWLLGGKARLKREIASRVTLDGAALPYTKPLVAWLREQKAAGRKLWLCTASDESLARAVAEHLGFEKTEQECEDHYERFYLRSKKFPIPDLSQPPQPVAPPATVQAATTADGDEEGQPSDAGEYSHGSRGTSGTRPGR